MTDSEAPYLRLRELAKTMASEYDPARLRVLAEELKTIVAKAMGREGCRRRLEAVLRAIASS